MKLNYQMWSKRHASLTVQSIRVTSSINLFDTSDRRNVEIDGSWLKISSINAETSPSNTTSIRIFSPSIEKFDNFVIFSTIKSFCYLVVMNQKSPVKLKMMQKLYILFFQACRKRSLKIAIDSHSIRKLANSSQIKFDRKIKQGSHSIEEVWISNFHFLVFVDLLFHIFIELVKLVRAVFK